MSEQTPSPRRPRRIIEAAPATRSSGWRWLAALPAILALATSVACAAMLMSGSSHQDVPWYRQLGERALADRDYDLGCVCYQRLLIDEPNNPAYQFGLAMSLAATGRGREASQLFARLSPPDAVGYLPARLFIAQQILQAAPPSSQMLDVAEANLHWLIADEPDNPELHGLLATAYADQGKWELCKSELSKTGSLRPHLEERLLPRPRPSHSPAALAQ